MLFAYYFQQKLFPTEEGSWNKQDESNPEYIAPGDSGWEGKTFWTSVSFPGAQNVCIKVSASTNQTTNSFEIPLNISTRDNLYPSGGTLKDLLSRQSVESIQDAIKKKHPFLLNNQQSNIAKDGKNIFFLGSSEKFLIPDRNIFRTYFRDAEDPVQRDTSSLPYSSELISFPEGILFSHANGVFFVSDRKPALIRSPEVFESLGYDWKDVIAVTDFEYNLLSGERPALIGFGATHPNGTILKSNDGLFFIFEQKKYSLSEEERVQYFPNQPEVETSMKSEKATCQSNGNTFSCCVNNFDPRTKTPQISPYNGTIDWDLSRIISKEKINKIDWQAKVLINKENSIRRLKSLWNYILAQFGQA